jgi:3-oxoacyl-[acyl-carrier-protein] synthase-3
MPAYLHDIGLALGDSERRLAESAAAGLLFSAPQHLAAAGFATHCCAGAGQSAYDLAHQALARIADALADADALIAATCLPLNANAGDPERFAATGDVKHLMDYPASRLQRAFGLERAIVLGLGQQACTSMLGSLRLAAMLLDAEPDFAKVVCVSADRFPPGAKYEQTYNLISDGAAACVVTRAAPDASTGGFRIVAAHHITNGALSAAADDEIVGTFFSVTHRLVIELLAKAKLAASDIAWVLPQNTNPKAWTIMARLLGIDPARVLMPTLPEIGHVISADNMANLQRADAEGRFRPGEHVLLTMTGFGLNWQAVLLEKA